MTAYATGKRALAICDVCGQTVKYRDLRRNTQAQRWTGLLVCRDCDDVDNEQLMLGRYRVDDPIALRNPRPDQDHTTGAARWDPVVGGHITYRGGTAHFVTGEAFDALVSKGTGFSMVGTAVKIRYKAGVATFDVT